MHAMVYGIVIAVPAPYTLLAHDHVTLRIFAGPDAAPLSGAASVPLVYAAGIVIHLFAPQVLLALAVCIIALRRYVNLDGDSCPGIPSRETARRIGPHAKACL